MENKEKKQLPSRQISVEVKAGEISNIYQIKFPTNNELIQIEAMKSSLSYNEYNGIARSGTAASSFARSIIDMIAFFTIMIPQLKTDMNVKTIGELHPIDSKQLMNVYRDQVSPWLNEWGAILESDDEELVDEKK